MIRKRGFDMRILTITVAGFKNIKKTKIEPDNICAVISPNNYGKSNLIEAIDFGFDFIHQSRKVRKNMMSWVKGIPLCSAMENDEYFFEIEFEDDKLEDYRFVKYGFTFKCHQCIQRLRRMARNFMNLPEPARKLRERQDR